MKRKRLNTIYQRKKTQKKLSEKKINIRSAPLSPGIQEHVAKHREKLRNTCIKIIQFVYYTINKVGRIVNPIISL